MRCDEFELLWNETLDRRANPRRVPELTAHAASCASCAELLSCGVILYEALATRPAPRPSGELAARVLAAWSIEQAASLASPLAIKSISLADTQPLTFSSQDTLPIAVAVPASSTIASAPRRGFSAKFWRLATAKFFRVAAAVAAGIAILLIVRPRDEHPALPQLHQPAPQNTVVNPLPQPPQPVVVVPVPQPNSPSSPARQVWSQSLALNRFPPERVTWVGYQVADGIKPVTNSMSAALQSWKKPLAKPDDMTAPRGNPNDSSAILTLAEAWV